MHSLIITAHPSSHGFTHAIAQKYRETKEKNAHTVEVLNLYTTDLKMGYLTYEEKSDMKNLTLFVRLFRQKSPLLMSLFLSFLSGM